VEEKVLAKEAEKTNQQAKSKVYMITKLLNYVTCCGLSFNMLFLAMKHHNGHKNSEHDSDSDTSTLVIIVCNRMSVSDTTIYRTESEFLIQRFLAYSLHILFSGKPRERDQAIEEELDFQSGSNAKFL